MMVKLLTTQLMIYNLIMKTGESIQCPSCGASSVLLRPNKPVLECEYCGSMMGYQPPEHNKTEPTKTSKLTLLLVMLPLIVIALMVIFWLVFQHIREQTQITQPVGQVSTPLQINSLPTVDVIPPSNHDSTPLSTLKEQLEILSQVSGTTINGGMFWVFSIKNKGPELISRPGVMVSLFDHDGKRVEEQGGWAILKRLPANQSTPVLVFVKDAPEQIADVQFSVLGTKPSGSHNQLVLAVSDYTMTMNGSGFEIVGDVVNPHEVNARYTNVVAVALDEKGLPVGVGNSMATEKELAPKQKSGFKVRVGTFLTADPVGWEIWAVASQ